MLDDFPRQHSVYELKRRISGPCRCFDALVIKGTLQVVPNHTGTYLVSHPSLARCMDASYFQSCPRWTCITLCLHF